MTKDEMQDAMMGPTEAVVFEEPIRVADEIPVGKEEELDQIEHRGRTRWSEPCGRIHAHRIREPRRFPNGRRTVVACLGQEGPREVPVGSEPLSCDP